MSVKISDTLPEIKESDICGLWEVIRVSRKNGNKKSYPWIRERFKYNFLPEMIFLCFKDGDCSHGTWELAEKIHNTKKQYSIILNGNFEFMIIHIEEDELTVSDRWSEYLLTRRF